MKESNLSVTEKGGKVQEQVRFYFEDFESKCYV
jgi:hypothetical protein